MNHEHMLTTREVAAALKVTPETVVKWLRRGRLAGFRLPGGAWRVPAHEITHMMAPMQFFGVDSLDRLLEYVPLPERDGTGKVEDAE
jgi:excisionase family DNA binding protein